MIKRLYVHNFRCLENFTLELGEFTSVLLLGKNGAGKTTVGTALEVFQNIARGSNRVGELIRPKDLTNGRTEVPARFEIEANLNGRNYAYSIAFEYPANFREMRVAEEALAVDGHPVFSRQLAQVQLARDDKTNAASFRIDWHLVALPIVQEYGREDPLAVFKNWLKNFVILKPIPSLAKGESELSAIIVKTPDAQATNIGTWFSNMVSEFPATYSIISDYLREFMPDFSEIKNKSLGAETRQLSFVFQKGKQRLELPLEELSDGEKCFVIYALAVAANATTGPLFSFWDEPDNFLAPGEVRHSVMALRRAFLDCGQLIVTSHNPETMRSFSEENTLYLSRKSHFEPTVVEQLADMRRSGKYQGGFVDALLRGDVDG